MTEQLTFFSQTETIDKNESESSTSVAQSTNPFARFAVQHPMVFALADSLSLTFNSIEDQKLCLLTVMAVGHALKQGHVCIDISSYAGKQIFLEYGINDKLPLEGVWLNWLNNQSFTDVEKSEINADTDMQHWDIFRLYQGYLYFSKWADWEQRLARQLLERARQQNDVDLSAFQKAPVFNWQNVAAINSLLSPLSIVVGGPGTGKTTAVAQILEAVLNAEGHSKYNMVLAAPTGKAAARMASALSEKMQNMDINKGLLNRVPKTAVTLHRLLAWSQERRQYRYNKQRPLLIDCIVVDEASMIDLAMFTTLLEALPRHCRVILLGDPYQLASVSAGSVLADICNHETLDHFSKQRCQKMQHLFDSLSIQEQNAPLLDNCVMLQQSYRFDDNAGIGLLAKSVLEADEIALTKALAEPQISFYQKTEVQKTDPLATLLIKQYQLLTSQTTVSEAFHVLNKFQLLCAVKEGEHSTAFYNASMLNYLQKSTGGSTESVAIELIVSIAIYHCMPLMMEKNHHSLGIYNGDMGLVWEENGRLRLFFKTAEGEIKSFSPTQVQGWTVAHAITVHKSQGSEYNEVAFASPTIDSPLLNKEMLYTAITRSKEHFYCLAELAELKRAILSPCQRVSALSQRLTAGEVS